MSEYEPVRPDLQETGENAQAGGPVPAVSVQAPPDGGFDPWKVYETLAAILNRREGVAVRLTGLTKDGEPAERGEFGPAAKKEYDGI